MAGSGVPSLDRVTGGFYWGDNVVWELEPGAELAPFSAALTAAAPGYARFARVALTELPEPADGIDVIDARDGSTLAQPQALLGAVRAWCAEAPGRCVVFDPLDVLAQRWGSATTRRFFSRACPLLLELGSVAYWSLDVGWQTHELRRTIEEITQCIFVLGDGRLRVAKADGRPHGVRGSVFDYDVQDGVPVLRAAPAAIRIGAALRALRSEHRLSQSDLARAANVSPSAISQAERGRRGLSVDTLLAIADRLEITLDELLHGTPAPGYRLGRRDHPRTQSEAALLPLLDNPRAGLRVVAVTLPPGGSADVDVPHKGVEAVAVGSGLVQVALGKERVVLRRGEALLAGTAGVTGWINLGDRPALAFWTLRDDTVAPGAT